MTQPITKTNALPSSKRSQCRSAWTYICACILLLLAAFAACDKAPGPGEPSQENARDAGTSRDTLANDVTTADTAIDTTPDTAIDKAPSDTSEPDVRNDAGESGAFEDLGDTFTEFGPSEQPPVPESDIKTPKCAPGEQPSPEICDGKDNDCDGMTDEDVIGCVGTLAGTGKKGATNGRGIAASFSSPSALAVGPKGHLWIADTENHVIRRIDRSTNEVTTYAGTGQAGERDGPKAQAQFNKPGALTIAANGDIYVADTVNHRIRKISAAGIVTTIAGQFPGLRNAQGADARFYFPSGIAYDGRRTLYIADTLNHCIRKLDLSGNASIYAGSCDEGFANGQGKAARFSFPIAIALNDKGELFVADGSNNMIRKVSATGVVSVLAGEGVRGYRDGGRRFARFYYPPGVTVAADGNVYVADASNQRIRRIAPDGQVTTVAGSGIRGRKDGPAQSAQFFGPTGIYAAHDRLYIADFNSHYIRMLRLR